MQNYRPPGFLCVSNFPANAGYAWDFIEGLYAHIADHLATHGIPTFVAYPTIGSPPRSLEGSASVAVELDASLKTLKSIQATLRFIRGQNIQIIYFTDRPARHWAYLLLRSGGVRSVIVHDHASGEWSLPRGPKRALKWLLARTPAIVADHVITVSNYVARRQTLVGHIPSARVEVVWNGLPIPPRRDEPERRTHAMFGLDIQRPLIMCACRAAPEKGVAFLLRAFERVVQQAPLTCPRPGLLYIGDGPQLLELRALADSLAARNDIILGGYRRDTKELLGGADLCVIPSLWQDAFPLAVLEAMALGKPVIATRVGGIPEMIEHGITGLLVAAGDEAELATAIRSILEDPNKARRLGEAARERVAQQFTPERQIRRLTEIVERGFRSPCEMVRQA